MPSTAISRVTTGRLPDGVTACPTWRRRCQRPACGPAWTCADYMAMAWLAGKRQGNMHAAVGELELALVGRVAPCRDHQRQAAARFEREPGLFGVVVGHAPGFALVRPVDARALILRRGRRLVLGVLWSGTDTGSSPRLEVPEAACRARFEEHRHCAARRGDAYQQHCPVALLDPWDQTTLGAPDRSRPPGRRPGGRSRRRARPGGTTRELVVPADVRADGLLSCRRGKRGL